MCLFRQIARAAYDIILARRDCGYISSSIGALFADCDDIAYGDRIGRAYALDSEITFDLTVPCILFRAKV